MAWKQWFARIYKGFQYTPIHLRNVCLGRSVGFQEFGRNPRIAPNHYRIHIFFNPRRALRRPRAPPGRRRVGKDVISVVIWSVPWDSRISEEILGSLQTTTESTSFSPSAGSPAAAGSAGPETWKTAKCFIFLSVFTPPQPMLRNTHESL